MSSPKRSPVFPGDVKPHHEGIYLREHPYGPNYSWLYSYWNGHEWGWCSFSLDRAYSQRFVTSNHQNLSWVGLAKPYRKKP